MKKLILLVSLSILASCKFDPDDFSLHAFKCQVPSGFDRADNKPYGKTYDDVVLYSGDIYYDMLYGNGDGTLDGFKACERRPGMDNSEKLNDRLTNTSFYSTRDKAVEYLKSMYNIHEKEEKNIDDYIKDDKIYNNVKW